LDAQAGRRLFFSAIDPRMDSLTTGIACASCHVEGREDGQVWNFLQGPRQTPSLAGRDTMQTAPFHWAGEFDNLTQFMSHTVVERMGGSGVDPDMERQLAAYISSIPAPDNALKDTTPAEVVVRGQAAFAKAECNTCHSTEHFTDNSFADVGTYATEGDVIDDATLRPHGGLNTPSILGIARTAPYLHTGAAPSIRARIMKGKEGDLHGKTAQLSVEEVDDLVAYLKTL
jgi:cytochrome c peroxidase